MRARWSALVLVMALATSAVPVRAAAQPVDPRTYRPPVDAPVVDPFRPPPAPWLPGNRGLEYATVPGSLVTAIGPGVVTFAGPVAGSLHVTVQHPDGLRSSYSFLAAVRTAAGRPVAAGEVVGVAGARLHLGVRRPDDTYLDPASLWGTRVGGGHVHLVPLDGGPHGGRAGRADAPAPPPGFPPPSAEPGTGVGAGNAGGRGVAARWSARAWARASTLAPGSWAGEAPSLHSSVGPPTGGPESKRPPGSTHGRRRGSAALDARDPGFAKPWVRRGP